MNWRRGSWHRPARFAFYLHESALRTPVGGLTVMAEQLCHLRRMSERSYLTLRVLPIALGAHVAMTGAFQAYRNILGRWRILRSARDNHVS